MGASSSSASRGAKNKRKISRLSVESGQAEDLSRRASRLLMQNNQIGNTGEWHTKAHSMYELQRERSMENNDEAAGAGEAEREHGKGADTAGKPTASSKQQQSKQQMQTSGKSAAAQRASAPTQCSRAIPGGPDSPISPFPTSNSSKPTQRRRPLTWAWLRGHDVTLPGTGAVGNEKRATAAAAARRRSLRAGMESLCVTHPSSSSSSNDWVSSSGSGIHRQLSANSPASTSTSNHFLGRRASQGRPFLAQVGRQKSARKSDAGLASSVQNNPISANGREIIQFCFEQLHNEIGVRICSRLLEKRPDFRSFVYTMGKERWLQMTSHLKEFLEMVVRRVDNIEAVERISRKYGAEHVELKCYGFKPDFWVSLADAITVECVILDQASHQPSDTITAWSLLVSIMFSAVRDGYYQAMRAQRISQRHKNVQQRETAQKEAENNNNAAWDGVEKSASAVEVKSNGAEKKSSTTGSIKQQTNSTELQTTMENGEEAN